LEIKKRFSSNGGSSEASHRGSITSRKETRKPFIQDNDYTTANETALTGGLTDLQSIIKNQNALQNRLKSKFIDNDF
jgi:hypothetical protein